MVNIVRFFKSGIQGRLIPLSHVKSATANIWERILNHFRLTKELLLHSVRRKSGSLIILKNEKIGEELYFIIQKL